MTGYYAAEKVRASGEFSYIMPNKLNFTFDMSFVCSIMLPTIYAMSFPMNYGLLLNQRKKYYKTKKEAL